MTEQQIASFNEKAVNVAQDIGLTILVGLIGLGAFAVYYVTKNALAGRAPFRGAV